MARSGIFLLSLSSVMVAFSWVSRPQPGAVFRARACSQTFLQRPHAGSVMRTPGLFAAPKGSSNVPPKPFTQPPLNTPSTAGDVSAANSVLKLAGGGAAVAIAAALGGVWIDTYSTTPCQLSPGGCTAIPLFMKVPLVATHLFAFMLIPATMFVFYTRAKELKDAGARDPFLALVGVSFLMVAIAGEIGWHVTQEWFYVEDYSILNFMFYFFLNLGSSLWAVGIKEDSTAVDAKGDVITSDVDQKVDIALLAAPVLAGVLYLLGAAVTHTKVPIYILLSFEYAALTQRFWKLLQTPKVLLFPVFSVGVNLFFISLLDKYQLNPVLNPLFHILHDAAGTEMGITIIAALTYFQLAEKRTTRAKAQ